MTILDYRSFLQTAATKLADFSGGDQHHALLLVNLERLAELDGVLGFAKVDEVMEKVSQQLQQSLNVEDLLGITGRYQICCLLIDLLSDAHATLAAHKILRILTPPFVIGRQNILLAPRIGVTSSAESGCKLEQLMSHASMAARQARLDNEAIRQYVATKEDPLLQHIDLWSDLGNAIETRELHLCYQPQVHLVSGKIESAEALLRWRHPERGLIPTDKLIQLAEGTELMSRLTSWVFNTALRECAEYRRVGLDTGVSVNFSAHDLRDPELLDLVMQGLQLWHVPPNKVTIELTETAVMENYATTLETLQKLKEMGFRLAMDDFGTGYSSMARMLDLPLDEVKIDMVFVKHLTIRNTHERIVDSMINLAHRLNLSVVAEGVEDYPTYERLRALGCDIIQGYLIGKAMPLPELIEAVLHQSPNVFKAIPSR